MHFTTKSFFNKTYEKIEQILLMVKMNCKKIKPFIKQI